MPPSRRTPSNFSSPLLPSKGFVKGVRPQRASPIVRRIPALQKQADHGALGHPTIFVRDAAGQVQYETNANNEVLQFAYNPAGQLLTLVDGENHTTTWKYDEYGRVTNKLDQAGTEIFRYQYDPADRLTNRWTSAKGNTIYKYDPIGNLTNVVYPVSSGIVFRYDTLNRLTNMVDGN